MLTFSVQLFTAQVTAQVTTQVTTTGLDLEQKMNFLNNY